MFKLSVEAKKNLSTELAISYSRSSGPGGQKVNKTETQVEVRWNVLSSGVFTEEQKQRILQKLQNRINKKDELVLTSEKFRSRMRNQETCIANLISLLETALTVQKPRKKSKPPFSSVMKRKEDKKRQSEKKKNRQVY